MTQPQKIKFSQLTLGELSVLEKQGGFDLGNIGDSFTSAQMAALAYILTKRFVYSRFTWNEALGLTLEDAQNLMETHLDNDEAEESDEEDPKALDQIPTYPQPPLPAGSESTDPVDLSPGATSID
jgi:hypothetical protein